MDRESILRNFIKWYTDEDSILTEKIKELQYIIDRNNDLRRGLEIELEILLDKQVK